MGFLPANCFGEASGLAADYLDEAIASAADRFGEVAGLAADYFGETAGLATYAFGTTYGLAYDRFGESSFFTTGIFEFFTCSPPAAEDLRIANFFRLNYELLNN